MFRSGIEGSGLSRRVDVPILAELIPDGIRPGTWFVVECDPASQWLSVASTIAARYLTAGGHVAYHCMARSPEDVQQNLSELRVDVNEAFKSDFLTLEDHYSATLTGGKLDSAGTSMGRVDRIDEGLRVQKIPPRAPSLRVQDLSVMLLRSSKSNQEASEIFSAWPDGSLHIKESMSTLLRFNEEKPFVEFIESRDMPMLRRMKRITLAGVFRGIHTEWLYNRLESAADGTIDIKVMEQEGEATNLLRVRSLRGQNHDAHWHRINFDSKGETTLAD
jgi:KaiC/GvpD/RAD55 family RecA-like ATPase